MFVCFDCCLLLNQCHEFHEKTNQAQYSLNKILHNTKVTIQQDVLSTRGVTSLSNTLENNFESNAINCYLNNEEKKIIIHIGTNDTNDLTVQNSNNKILEIEESKSEIYDQKKILTKLSNKNINNNKTKIVKKKNIFLEINEPEFQNFLSDDLDLDNGDDDDDEISSKQINGIVIYFNNKSSILQIINFFFFRFRR